MITSLGWARVNQFGFESDTYFADSLSHPEQSMHVALW